MSACKHTHKRTSSAFFRSDFAWEDSAESQKGHKGLVQQIPHASTVNPLERQAPDCWSGGGSAFSF